MTPSSAGSTLAPLSYRLPQQRKLNGALPGPASQLVARRRDSVVARGVASSVPVYAKDADGGILVDVDGNSLIDLGTGIAVTGVGASHPAVAQAVAQQAQHFTHTCFMVTPYESYVQLAEELSEITPGGHEKRTVLFNSGAEAVENAVKIARAATGRQAVVAFDHAYHGRTNLTMALTAKAMPYKHGFGPFAPEVYRVPMSYPFREPVDLSGVEAAQRAISLIEKQIGADQVAAVLIEPIQGEGGFIVPADGFLPTIAAWAIENSVVFIADEVQTGFCRTGSWFAVDHEHVIPDLMTMAKGIAGGMPLSAVTGRAELMDAVHTGGLGGTYGGNPVACAAALATLEVMRDEHLAERARVIERLATTELLALQREAGESSIIGQVRGRGAMLAIEFVVPGTAGASKTPYPEAAARVAAACLAEGVVILTCGTFGNVIRLLPPLVIGEALLRDGLAVLSTAIRSVQGK